MKTVFKAMSGTLRNGIRAGYLLVIILLAIFGWRTWQQLQTLRSVPVALPNYWFYMAESQGQPLVQANGTWIDESASLKADHLQTSTFECSKARMQCVESAAVVTVMEQSFLEAMARFYDIESWTDQDIVTRPVQVDKCRVQTVRFVLAEKKVLAKTSLAPDASEQNCRHPAHQLRLDDGNKLLNKRT